MGGGSVALYVSEHRQFKSLAEQSGISNITAAAILQKQGFGRRGLQDVLGRSL